MPVELRFQYSVEIEGLRDGQRWCEGIIFDSRHVLTTASCASALGPNPVVIINAQKDTSSDDWRPAKQVPQLYADHPALLPAGPGNWPFLPCY